MKLEGLYDMIGFKPEKENVFEEQRLRQAVENSKGLCKRNKDIFNEHADCYNKCIRYDPCPICDKCQNKASHLYVKCQTCQIPICVHKYHDRDFMIKRKNFKIYVSKDTMNQLDKLAEKVKKERNL